MKRHLISAFQLSYRLFLTKVYEAPVVFLIDEAGDLIGQGSSGKSGMSILEESVAVLSGNKME